MSAAAEISDACVIACGSLEESTPSGDRLLAPTRRSATRASSPAAGCREGIAVV
jgi:hypothetical protein